MSITITLASKIQLQLQLLENYFVIKLITITSYDYPSLIQDF